MGWPEFRGRGGLSQATFPAGHRGLSEHRTGIGGLARRGAQAIVGCGLSHCSLWSVFGPSLTEKRRKPTQNDDKRRFVDSRRFHAKNGGNRTECAWHSTHYSLPWSL